MSGVLTLRTSLGSGTLTPTVNATTLRGVVLAPGTARTDYVTVTVVGGRAPYTYAWVEVGGPTTTFVSDATSASTRFSASFGPAGGEIVSVYKCTVTDANTTTADTENITITLEGSVP